MTLYLDTSVLVSALVNEPATPKTQQWLADHVADGLSISDWVVTEFSSALSLKLRTGALTPTDRANALSVFTDLRMETIAVLAVGRDAFRTAARFADQQDLSVRSGDALHLAICAEHALTLCTLDRRLAQAGPPLGVATRLL